MSGGSLGRRVAAIGRRVRADYGGKDRAAEYRTLLETARDAGYALVSLGAFRAAVAADAAAPAGPILALRHDIDVTDVAGNEAFLAAETAVGATATYYLRLATAPAHAAFVGRLHDAGFDVGYHYEEAATAGQADPCARPGRRRGRAARPSRPPSGGTSSGSARATPPTSARSRSHGDWMNRALGFRNNEFVTPELLAACGLDFEAYDASILGRADAYVSDVATPPAMWADGLGLTEAIAAGSTRIVMLTHERQWHTNRTASLRVGRHPPLRGARRAPARLRRRPNGDGAPERGRRPDTVWSAASVAADR